MVVIKCKMLEINQIIVFMEQFFKEYLTYFQPTTTLHYLVILSIVHIAPPVIGFGFIITAVGHAKVNLH